LLFAFFTGVGGYAIGLVMSILFDLPAGALIVWCLSLLAMLVYGFGPTTPKAV
jgi:zinc/manganese transport system permease protein